MAYTVVAVVVAIVVAFAASGGGGSASFTGQPPGADELARLHEIRDRAAAVRGIEVGGAVREEYLSRDGLAAYVDDAFDELSDNDIRDLESLTLVMRLLRMIGPEDDLLEIYAASNSLGIAGFYSYEEKRLVIVTEELSGGVIEESILAHEYTHALQDSEFDLTTFLERQDTAGVSEYGSTLSCVIEGDASVMQIRYLEDRYGDDWVTLYVADYRASDELQEEQEEYTSAIPEAIQRYTGFNYGQCATFVAAVWEEGGWEAVDRLYAEPPSTTEQVLHPELYFAGEEAQAVEMPNLRSDLGPGWKLFETASFGEFDVYNYLVSAGVSMTRARAAAAGWGGGVMQIYTLGAGDGGQALLHIGLVWDSDSDADGFRSVFDDALDLLRYDVLDSGPDLWRWSGGGDEGYARWDEANQRIDLLFSNDEAALEAAAVALD